MKTIILATTQGFHRKRQLEDMAEAINRGDVAPEMKGRMSNARVQRLGMIQWKLVVDMVD